jgi:succinate-semialdehyde dehydrogenase/glutarate-semialdehyde dehydrogenase
VRTLRTGLFIGGRWFDGDTNIAVCDPATDEIVARVATASVEQCLDAVDAATIAQRRWQATAPRERAECLRRAFDLMLAELEPLAELITAENGKTLSEARSEVNYAAEFLRWFSEEATRIGGELRRAPAGDKNIVVLRQPVGVSLLVTPWNFPAAMATRKIGPALAAGCAVVLKPAPETPLTALAVADVLARAGVPDGVVNVVLPEPPDDAVRAMLASGKVRKLSFTGSTEVGSVLLAETAPRVVRCSLELGGNAPFVVFDDADLGIAVEAAVAAKLRNGGASCVAANRFYVHERLHDAFVDRFADVMGAQRVGAGARPDVDVGALVNHAERDRVGSLVDGALDGGATLLTGGSAWVEAGAFHVPTVLVDVDRDAPIIRSEIFGPVAAVVPFDDGDDIEALATDSTTGLIAYAITRDIGRALQFAEAVDTGMVAINRGVISDPAAPFGGVRGSGIGREGGREGIEEYLETKYIGVDW